MPIKVSISGAVGAGKSSVMKEVVKKLKCKTADVGQVFRSRAISKGLTIAEYDKIIEKNPQEDIDMEKDFKNLIEKSDENIIVSWRMGFHLMPEILSIRLDVSDEEGAKRVFADDRGKQEQKYKTRQEAMKANKERENAFKQRFLKVYGVDFTDKKNYKVIIKTDGKTLNEVVDEVIKTIENK